MAVLLECTSCYQSYAVPEQALRGRTTCPWCGAPSSLPPLSVPAEASAARSSRGFSSAAAFPELSPSRFPKRRQATPAVLWMIVGIGLGAAVVLAVITFSPAGFLQGADQDDSEPRSVSTVVRQPVSDDSSPATASQPSETRTALPTRAEVQAEIKRVQLLRQVVREELDRAVADDPRDVRGSPDPLVVRGSPDPTHLVENPNPRWKSDRPSPIGDPGDDSPPLGLMLPERREPPVRPVETAVESRPALPAKDDAKAISALVAAGIRCDKESEGGRVTRVDGSFRMTDALMAHVAKLPGLVHLKLSFAEVTDAGLAHVKDLTELEELMLNQTKITDTGLAHLEKLTRLKKLDLEKTLVSDDAVARLKTLKELNHLDLRGTKITPAAAASLKEALPAAKLRQ
jgi:hypothetical protein